MQRGNVSIPNLQVLNAILYVAEHGCKWRGLPKRFGNWHTIYTRMNRWAKAGVLDCVFRPAGRADHPGQDRIAQIGQHDREGSSGWYGGLEKKGSQSIGKCRGWTTKIHMVAADVRTMIAFTLSPGQDHDAPAGRELLRTLEPPEPGMALVMDRATLARK